VADEDYAATSGTLTFAPGTITQTVAIPITDDQAGEADEVFRLTLHDPINAALETPDTALVTIVDDDTTPQVQFSAPHSSVREDDGSVPVTVTLSIAAPLTVTGDVVSRDGSATTGSDYTAVDETLTFAPGEVEQVVTVAVTDDDEAEEDETVTLRLRDAVNGSPGPQATHTLIIQDDETAVSGDPTGFPGIQFSADAYTVHEAAGTAAVTVTLSKAATQPVTVMCTSADGSATADQDYTPVDVLLTFAPGEMQQTVAVAITDDDAEEADETLMLTLHDTVNATLGIPAEATVTIASDDGRPASGPRPVYLPIVQRGTFDE
jgi:hypothetical protein